MKLGILRLLVAAAFMLGLAARAESVKNQFGESCELLDWMHVKAYAGLSGPQSKCVVILADDLALEGGMFGESRTGSLYIIANRLRVLANSEISVWSENEYLPDDYTNRGQSPSLVIAARHLLIGSDGFLKLISRGNPGGLVALYTSETDDWEYEHPSARKKQVLKDFYKNVDYAKTLADDVLTSENSNQGYQGAEYRNGQERAPNGEMLFFGELQRFRPAGFGSVWLSGTERRYSRNGPVKGLQQRVTVDLISKFKPWPACCIGAFDLSKRLPGGATTLSLWSLRRLQYLSGVLQTQYVTSSRAAQVQSLRDIARAVSEQYPISNEHIADYTAALSSVGELRSKIMPKVLRESQTIAVDGRTPEAMTVFIENGDMKSRVAPNMALAIERRLGTKKILGLLSKGASNDSSVELTFDAKLHLDSLSSVALSAKLKAEGQSLDGVFSNWTLGPFVIDTPGIRSATVKAVGNTLQLNLVLDAVSGNIALWRLWTEAGIPMSVDYTSKLDPTVRGTLTIPITFARRAEQSVSLRGRELTYQGGGSAVLDYILANGIPVFFNSSIRFDSTGGKPIKVSLPEDVEIVGKVEVPVDAVRYVGSPVNWEEFDTNLGASGLIQQVRVENLLPAYDTELKMGQDFVDFIINYTIGSVTSAVGPFRLAPRGADGSSMVVSFLRPAGSNVYVEVKGTASYDGESSRRSFRLGPVAAQSIKISPGVFSR